MSGDPLTRFLELRTASPRRIVGLISGTSADGIDAALVEIEGAGDTTVARLLDFRTRPFEPGLRARILGLKDARADELLRVHYELGEEFAEAALAGHGRGEASRASSPPDRIPWTDRAAPSARGGPRRPRGDAPDRRAGDHRRAHRAARRGRLSAARRRRRRRGRAPRSPGRLAPVPPARGHARVPEHGRHRQRDGGHRAARDRARLRPGAVEHAHGHRRFHAWTHGAETFDRDGARAARGRPDPALVAELLRHPFFGFRRRSPLAGRLSATSS